MAKRLGKFAAAAIIYLGFAVYLYQPYLKAFSLYAPQRYLLVINVWLASLGCYVLSRRWISSFAGSFFAGALYGLGPFALGLAKFHPTAGLLAATIPWLFCPAALWAKNKWSWLSWPLSAIPFLSILLFFQISVRWRLFAIPIQIRLHLADLAGLLTPLFMANKSTTLISFYHIPIATLVIGISMLLAAHRFGIMIIFSVGTILAFCKSLLGVSPVIWAAIPVLCCSVIIGAGIQGLIWAGPADRKWILASTIIMALLAIAALLLATKYFQIFLGLGSGYAKLFVHTAKMYALGAVTVAIIYFTARAKLHILWLRVFLLSLTIATDVFLSARFIVDKAF